MKISDPLALFMGADGHSNNTGELQAVAEALLWLKDTERLGSRGLQQTRQRRSVETESHGRSFRWFPIRPPVVAVSEKILAI